MGECLLTLRKARKKRIRRVLVGKPGGGWSVRITRGILGHLHGCAGSAKTIGIRRISIEKAIKNDQAYADPSARLLVPGNAIRTTPIDDIRENLRAYLSRRKEIDGVPTAADVETRQKLFRGWLAAQRSPLAALGFDPHYLVISPKHSKGDVGPAGMYQAPKDEQSKDRDALRPDTMWVDLNDDWALAHEAMHRGLSLLRRAGLLPANVIREEEELFVRALMTRHFGDIELGRGAGGDQQIYQARELMAGGRISKEDLDKLEAAAAKLYYEGRRPSDGELDPDKPHVWIMGPH